MSTRRRIAAVLLLCALSGGCAHRRAPLPPPLRGTVNLEALVRRHPGWSGVGQYDAALRRLQEAARNLPPPGRADEKMAVLPALPTEASLAGPPDVDVAQTGRRLEDTQKSLISALRERRAMARADQLRQERSLWVREARRRFNTVAETTDTSDLDLQLLQTSVGALARTVGNWNAALPPAPKLKALRQKVTTDSARLQTLFAERARQRAEAAARRRDEAQRVRDARTEYVRNQQDAQETRLRADDDRLIAAQEARLIKERTELLQALAQPAPALVAATGYSGSVTLPHGPGIVPASLSQASLTASETRLRAERARWVKYLYDDTQAAAKDTAQGHRWDITFGPPRPGDVDLTAALAQAMAAGIWHL